MTNPLHELTRILPPPMGRVAGPPWGQCRADVGFEFPSDYRAFVDLYGQGHFGEPGSLNFHIYAPSSVPELGVQETGFKGFVEWHVSDIADMWEGCDEDHWGGTVYPMYPEPGGLLTWGENEQGDMLWWLTEGDDPDQWPVVMWARGLATTLRFDIGMVGLILAIFEGKAFGPDLKPSAQARWTMTSDWLRSGLNISAGPGPLACPPRARCGGGRRSSAVPGGQADA